MALIDNLLFGLAADIRVPQWVCLGAAEARLFLLDLNQIEQPNRTTLTSRTANRDFLFGFLASGEYTPNPNMPQRRSDSVPTVSDTGNIGLPPQGLRPYLLTQGMVFVDGQRLEQVETYRELGQKDARFWCEYDGMKIHVRLPGDADPAVREVEVVVQDTVLRPSERELGYILLKGLTFEHAANPFPRPQRGMVSTNRGHHWIIEDCTLRHANSVALDIGNESPDADGGLLDGYSIVRRNHVSDAGICGIAGTELGKGALVEENLVEDIGWQNAEPARESAGIKLHCTVDTLLRNNVIRHIR